jgi:hypothetical protein
MRNEIPWLVGTQNTPICIDHLLDQRWPSGAHSGGYRLSTALKDGHGA